jgi:hypothetical protein
VGAPLSVDADAETFALGAAGVPLLAPITYAYYLVAALPAVGLLLATEVRREDGLPSVPVVAVLLLGLHPHGLWFVTNVLPGWVPSTEALKPLFWAQPGLWGNLLLVLLAGWRVAEAVEVPAQVRRVEPADE